MNFRLLKSLMTVSGLTVASRVLGFARQILMAGVIGAGGSPVADAFWAAFRLPNMFRRLFAEGAFHAAFIPLFQRHMIEGGEKSAKEFAEEVLASLAVILLLLTIIVELAAPLFVFLIAAGFKEDPEKFALTTLYTRIMFPYLAMMSLVGLLSGILNSLNRFAAAAGAPLALNICLIVAVLIFADQGKAVTGYAAAWAVFAGGIVQLLVLVFGASRQKFALRPRAPRLTPRVKRLFILGAPGFISAGAVQINLIIGTNIASREPGAVSWLMNADQLYQLPLSVIGIALGVVLLPMLSRRVKEGDEEGAARAINRSLEFSALMCFPAAVAFIVIGAPICDALFRSLAADALSFFGARESAFTAHDAAMTGAALGLFGIGLPAFVWHKIFSPAFFAREDTKTPMRYALISIAANTILSLALFPMIGFFSVAIGTVAAAWLQVVLLARQLYLRGQFKPSAMFVGRLMKIIAASTALGFGLSVAASHLDQLTALFAGRLWLAVIALSGAGAVAYGVVAFALGAVRLSDYKAPVAKASETKT